MSESDAVITQKLAYNQGFYNLFLALAIIVAFTMGPSGRLLMDYAMASILAAAVVLFASSPGMLRAVLIQGLPGVVYFTLRWL